MKNFFLLLALLFTSQPAQASICPGAQANASFGASFYNASTLTAFLYDTDYDTLYVTLSNNTWIAYQNVPYSTAYQFAAITTPDAFYAQQVKPIYQAALETNTCQQLVTENNTVIVVN